MVLVVTKSQSVDDEKGNEVDCGKRPNIVIIVVVVIVTTTTITIMLALEAV